MIESAWHKAAFPLTFFFCSVRSLLIVGIIFDNKTFPSVGSSPGIKEGFEACLTPLGHLATPYLML